MQHFDPEHRTESSEPKHQRRGEGLGYFTSSDSPCTTPKTSPRIMVNGEVSETKTFETREKTLESRERTLGEKAPESRERTLGEKALESRERTLDIRERTLEIRDPSPTRRKSSRNKSPHKDSERDECLYFYASVRYSEDVEIKFGDPNAGKRSANRIKPLAFTANRYPSEKEIIEIVTNKRKDIYACAIISYSILSREAYVALIKK